MSVRRGNSKLQRSMVMGLGVKSLLNPIAVGGLKFFYNGGVTSTTTLPAYATVDLSLTYTWRPHDGVFRKVKITGYSDNLLDEKHVVYAYVDGYQGGSKNYEQVQEGAPLFVGITLAALF